MFLVSTVVLFFELIMGDDFISKHKIIQTKSDVLVEHNCGPRRIKLNFDILRYEYLEYLSHEKEVAIIGGINFLSIIIIEGNTRLVPIISLITILSCR